MCGQRRLRPLVQDALGGAGDELLGAFADQADDLGAGFVVEAARGQDLRDLLAELAIAMQRFFNLDTYRTGEPVP